MNDWKIKKKIMWKIGKKEEKKDKIFSRRKEHGKLYKLYKWMFIKVDEVKEKKWRKWRIWKVMKDEKKVW